MTENQAVPTQEGEFLSIKEVAKILRLSELSIMRLIERRELPFYRFTRRIRIRRSDLESFIARMRHDPDLASFKPRSARRKPLT